MMGRGDDAARRLDQGRTWHALLAAALLLASACHPRTAEPQARPAEPAPAPFLIPDRIPIPTWNAAAEEGWSACPTGRTYAAGPWRVEVRPDGTIAGLRFHDLPLIRQALIHGRYLPPPGEAHDARIFQGPAGDPLMAREEGGRLLLRRSGVLGNRHIPVAAVYRQDLMLEPGRICCAIEITLRQALAGHDGIFMSLMELPLSCLAGHGYRTVDSQGAHRLAVVPRVYARDTDLRMGGLLQVCWVADGGWLVFSGAEGGTLSLSDTRSHGGQDLRLDAMATVPWTATPKLHPVGTVFRWRWSCAFRPFPENPHQLPD